MRLPDVVIAGAPRCGTTALFAWLVAHPQVCGTAAKETRYLMDASSPLLPARNVHNAGLDGYARLFAHCPAGLTAVEATPDYLYQQTPVRMLASLRPIPHVVIVLRRPSTRLYSFYQYARNNMALLPREVTFAEYLRRIRDPQDTTLDGLGTLGHQLAYGRYADYLVPWLEAFPPERISVFLFEHLVDDPRRELEALSRRIGVDPAFYATYRFERINPSYEVRSQRLQRFRKAAARVTPGGSLKRGLRSLYERVLTRRLAESSAEPEQLAELDADYREANRRLAALLNIDLQAWK